MYMSQSDEITQLRSPTPIIIPSTALTSRSLSAAIYVLPNELLAEVFLAGQEDHSLSPWSQKIPFEILVSRVSPHWRILAHDTPRLWTSVIIDTRVKNHLENAARYIQRSGAVSLDVFVRVLAHRKQPLLTTLAICRLLSAEVARLWRLRMESLSDEAGFTCLQVFFGNMPKSAPHLQMLDIRLSGQNYFNLPMNQSVFPDGLPSLKSLHFVSVSPRDLLLPRCPITSLRIHQFAYYDTSLRSASHFLSAVTQLILSESCPSPAWDSERFLFPSLKGLYMRQLDDYDKILSTIVAPELDTLYLEAVTEDEMTEIIGASHPPESNSSKFPRLRHFMLALNGGRTLPYGLWHAMMDAFPQVTHFTLLDADIGNFLLPFGASHSPWPMLEMLSLPNIGAGLLADVIAAVSNRANMGYPVRRLQLSPTLFAEGERFWRSAGVAVEVAANPLTSLPAECRAEEWQVEDELDGDDMPGP